MSYELIIKKEYPLVTYYIYRYKRSFVIYIVENFYPRTMRIYTRRRRLVEKMINALISNDYDEITNVLHELYLRFIM